MYVHHESQRPTESNVTLLYEAHPFGLIYEYMDGLDLKQYLRNQPNVERVKVVVVPLHFLSPSYLICRS